MTQSGHIHIFGVRFNPWGLSLLLRFTLSEITHRTWPLGELFPAAWRELEERLAECDGDDERVVLVDAFLAAALARTGRAPPRTVRAHTRR